MQIPLERIESAKEPVPEPKSKTVEVQTVFRESHAQTDPYSPNYEPDYQNVPEVLQIAKMRYGDGLPATMHEMHVIEQMRDKRAFDYALPPTSDEACFSLRRKLMVDQEIREWEKRNSDIMALQNERLNLLQSALVEREKETEEKHAQRTEEIRLKKTENKERALAKIQRNRIKVLRKMYKARKNVEFKGAKRDIIQEYACFGSTVYAPITRDGLSLDKKANKYEVQPEALSSYAGLQELHNVLGTNKPGVFESRVDVSKLKKVFNKNLSRKEKEHMQALGKAQVFIDIKQERKKDAIGGGPADTEDLEMRPITPEHKLHGGRKDLKPWLEEDKKRRAIILFQRLIRGRAMQNMMFEGKEKRLDLITELRATEEWKSTSDMPEERELLAAYQERIKDGVAEALQSSIISKTMDSLAKELVRLKQERHIAAMVRLAEDDRRQREAQESGRRQAEQVLRMREDKLYDELMRVHQGSVDSYLHNIITGTIDDTSSQQAYFEAKLKVKSINEFLDKQEAKRNSPAQLIKDLVSSFLIPDIDRKQNQRNVQLEERKFLEAARKTIQQSVINTGSKLDNEQMQAYANKNQGANAPK